MKHLLTLTLLLLLLLPSASTGQSTDAAGPFMIVEVTGKPTATTSKGTTIKLEPSVALLDDGSITLSTNEKVILAVGNTMVTLDKAGTHELNAEMAGNAFEILSFDPLFANYLKSNWQHTMKGRHHAGVNFPVEKRGDGWGANDVGDKGGWGANDVGDKGGWGANDVGDKGGWGAKEPLDKGGWGKKNPKGTDDWGTQDPADKGGWGAGDDRGDGDWGTQDDGDKGGWGIADMTIVIESPGGKYTKQPHTIRWQKQKGICKYLFVIMDEDLNMVHSEIAKKKVTYDFSKLDESKTYYWQLFAKNHRAISVPVTFTVVSDATVSALLKQCKSSDTYASGSPSTRGLMEAIAMEDNMMYLDTDRTFEQIIKSDKKNDLLKMSHAAYSLRMGQYSKARKIAEKM